MAKLSVITLGLQDVYTDMLSHDMVPAKGAYSTKYVFVPSSQAIIDAKQIIIGYNFGRQSLDC